ncbi:MAG: Crp/Fnr family transcriptional regulator [Chitinophagales bacterium]|nr:Crp/Fnr family transcriptional regulator [Chitinophagales bacterium]
MDTLLQKVQSRFPYVTAEKLADILAMGEVVVVQPGEILFKEGVNNARAAIVLEGILRNYTYNSKGEEITTLLVDELRAAAPYSNIFLNKPATETTEAVEQSLVFLFVFPEVQQKMEQDLVLLRLYKDLVQDALINSIQRIEDFTRLNPVQRYERLLQDRPTLLDRVPLKFLASYLGITAVSLSRIRKRISKSRN